MLHTDTAATLYWAVFWVSRAAVIAVVLALLLAAPYYVGPFLARVYRQLLARWRSTG